MSLATRCTACGTVFRVVQDQLKVSEGWVRCGRCSEVFNALEGLFDLEREAPPEWSPPVTPPVPAAHAPAVAPLDADSPKTDKIDAQLLGPRHADNLSTPATRIDERDRRDFPDAQFDPDMLREDAADSDIGAMTALVTRAEPEAPTKPVAPEFMRHAQRRARWQRPMVRAALVAMLLLLSSAWALQIGHHFRDLIAARWPATRPALVAWCDVVSCAIEAPRRIDDVQVESTALTRAGADAFKLSVALRNRGVTTVALPSIDLSLTDPAGQLVARKILAPADFRAASTTVQPGAESALAVVLATGGARVTGYTVEVFYP